jgi:hypothetical protein
MGLKLPSPVISYRLPASRMDGARLGSREGGGEEEGDELMDVEGWEMKAGSGYQEMVGTGAVAREHDAGGEGSDSSSRRGRRSSVQPLILAAHPTTTATRHVSSSVSSSIPSSSSNKRVRPSPPPPSSISVPTFDPIFSTLPPPKRRATQSSSSRNGGSTFTTSLGRFQRPAFLPSPVAAASQPQASLPPPSQAHSRLDLSRSQVDRSPFPRPPHLTSSTSSQAASAPPKPRGATATLANGRKITLWAPPPLPPAASLPADRRSPLQHQPYAIVNSRPRAVLETNFAPANLPAESSPSPLNTSLSPKSKPINASTSKARRFPSHLASASIPASASQNQIRRQLSLKRQADRYAQLQPRPADEDDADFW